MIKNKRIVLGITGSIAAYKSADLASKLTQAGASVDVIMTRESQEFITPLTLRSLTDRPVFTSMWDAKPEVNVSHIGLAEAADLVVIAPATANIIAKLAAGIADDMITCTVLATSAPVLISPAMHTSMYHNVITQQNIEKLKKRGFRFVGPAKGRLLSGSKGEGRFIESDEIMQAIDKVIGSKSDLLKKHIIVTAGGTQEAIDPVRCISNHSSGKMGYAIAEAARDRGATVTLITAPAMIDPPSGIDIIHVVSCEDMFKAIKNVRSGADALIMAAAVADYRPKRVMRQKIKRQITDSLNLELEKTTDILSEIKGNFLRVGFAAESQNLILNATEKLKRKNLDLIVANDITIKNSTFGSDDNQVVIIDKEGKAEELPLMPKRMVADKILDRILSLFP